MKYLNQLEPDNLIKHFLQNPPCHFKAWLTSQRIPVFETNFDLLTTAEDDFREKINKLPLKKWWLKWLKPKTLFVGTTVSEYVLFNGNISVQSFVCTLKQQYTQKYPLIIVKDIPQQSPLQTAFENQYAAHTINTLKQQGFIEIEGQALAWVPVDYNSIDDYIMRFSYQRRKNFRRKLKLQQQLDIDILNAGDRCFFEENILDSYYQLYLNVYKQSEIHFDQLTKPFLTALLQDNMMNSIIITYRYQGKLIGYNICFIVGDMLIDKYIGFDYSLARKLNLYYISWFYNLEYARKHNLKYYVAGWADPNVKAQLGAKFTFTKHLVYIKNPILRAILKWLSSYFESDSHHIIKNNERR